MLQDTKINPSPNIRATGNVKYMPSGRTFEQKHTYIARTTKRHAIAIDLAIILRIFPERNALAKLQCPVRILSIIKLTPNTHDGLDIAQYNAFYSFVASIGSPFQWQGNPRFPIISNNPKIIDPYPIHFES